MEGFEDHKIYSKTFVHFSSRNQREIDQEILCIIDIDFELIINSYVCIHMNTNSIIYSLLGKDKQF